MERDPDPRPRGGFESLIVTREPDRICWSDACHFGLGGYSISERAWRLQLPLGHPGINNLLEFTAMVVNVWLECLDAPDDAQPCVLAIGDSTSGTGWLFKTSKLEATPGEEHDVCGLPPGQRPDGQQQLHHISTHQRRHERCRRPLVVLRDQRTWRAPPPRKRRPPKRCPNSTLSRQSAGTGAGELSNLTVAQRSSLLRHTSAANRSIIFGSCREARNEDADRLWRRWVGFCRASGSGSDLLITMLSHNEGGAFFQGLPPVLPNNQLGSLLPTFRNSYEPSGCGHCATSRRPLGYGVSEPSPGQPRARQGKLQHASLR